MKSLVLTCRHFDELTKMVHCSHCGGPEFDEEGEEVDAGCETSDFVDFEGQKFHIFFCCRFDLSIFDTHPDQVRKILEKLDKEGIV